jgi:hypothetical protein
MVPKLDEAKLVQLDRLRIGNSGFSLRETFEQIGNAAHDCTGTHSPLNMNWFQELSAISGLSLVEASQPLASTPERGCVRPRAPLRKRAAAGPRLSRVSRFRLLDKSLPNN